MQRISVRAHGQASFRAGPAMESTPVGLSQHNGVRHSAADLIDAMSGWLIRESRAISAPADLLAGLGQELRRVGVPLDRATTHAPTLHPEYRWVMRVWRPERGVEEMLRRHGIEETPTFRGNTVDTVVATGEVLEINLDRGEGENFPVIRELRDEGFTQYLIAPLVFGDGSRGATSWATASPAGFSTMHVALFRALADVFALAFEARELRRGLGLLLGSYVGVDPARRITEGTVRRGDVCRMRAVIMVTDMRNSTLLSERLGNTAFVDRLNEHFDRIVPAIRAQGGEILKFTGDGVLAVFDAGRRPGAVQLRALEASRSALKSLARLNAELPPADAIKIGVGLHIGELVYGNIGSGDRLDFTTIGRDVNLATRLEKLCKPLGRELLLSKPFTVGLDTVMTSLGTHDMPGIAEPQEVFGVSDYDGP
jgi:adenylate cyclase